MSDPDRPLPAAAKRHRERRGWFILAAVATLPLMSALVKYTFIDEQKLPATGAFVLAPNHYTNIDPVVIGVAMYRLGRNPRFLAKSSLFRIPVIGFFLTKLGQIPVHRGERGRAGETVSAAQALVDSGGGVVVYPEGSLTRDPDLWPMRGKTGAARIALEAGVPVVPMVHWGTDLLMGRYSSKIRFFPRTHVTVRFGDPVDLSELRGRRLDQSVLNAATDRIMAAITALLEEVRGETAPPERWDPAAHGQADTGRL